MKNKVLNYIKKHKLIEMRDHIIVGVSGGADSMCLLHILKDIQKEYGLHLTVAHINHGIREEAKDDAAFVRGICRRWNIPYKEHRCNIEKIAKAKKCSEEEAGRDERYMFFEKVRIECGGDKISVAHTMNDQAETMLMRLIRGTGITGLGGIMSKRECIIRPLLAITREEVEDYCKEHNILFKEDITNQMDIYTRNKLRLQVLPMLKREFNPKIVESLALTSQQLQETEEYLEIQTKEVYKILVKRYKDGYSIPIVPFLQCHLVIQSRLIRKVIEKHIGTLKNVSHQNIYDILELFRKQSGKRIQVDKNTIAIREHLFVRIINNPESENYAYNLDIGVQQIKEWNKRIEISVLNNSEIRQTDENAYTKNIDYDKINGNVQIRNRRPGDKILFKNGSKKLKDFFIDEKIPKTSRDDVVLIADDENIIWVVGYRLSERYYITEKTKRILQIKITDLCSDDEPGGI